MDATVDIDRVSPPLYAYLSPQISGKEEGAELVHRNKYEQSRKYKKKILGWLITVLTGYCSGSGPLSRYVILLGTTMHW